MLNNKFISLVIPAYNEENNIAQTLKYLKNFLTTQNFNYEIIVVDDGSQDNTFAVSKEYKVRVIKLKKNYGKGKALQIGMQKAQGNILVMLDADLKESVIEVTKLIKPVMENKCDMAIAKFENAGGGGFGILKNFAKLSVKILGGQYIEFPLSGQRAFKKEIFTKVKKFAKGYGIETAFTIDTLRAGFKILEVDTNFKQRTFGKSLKGFLHRGKQMWEIGKVVGRRV